MKNETSKSKFLNKGDFSKELRTSINEYFVSKGIKKTGDWRLFSKTIILFSLFLGSYCILVFSHAPPWIKIPICFLISLVIVAIGFCVMHDAIHGSYSSSKNLNYIMGLSLNFLGGNNFLWKKKHNDIHHKNTNIDGLDEDIEAQPMLRLHNNQEWLPRHKYQHKWWYWMTVYGLLYLVWIWGNDYQKYFTKKILNQKINLSLKEHFIFWISKIFYVTIFLVVPIFYLGFWPVVISYFFIMILCGIILAVTFQLAHVVLGLEQKVVEQVKGVEFFEHQIATTANFATNNKIVTWFVGGLNFQIEHHLFPKISHIHYPEISKIRKSICNKWNISSIEYETVSDAIKNHVLMLKFLGQRPVCH